MAAMQTAINTKETTAFIKRVRNTKRDHITVTPIKANPSIPSAGADTEDMASPPTVSATNFIGKSITFNAFNSTAVCGIIETKRHITREITYIKGRIGKISRFDIINRVCISLKNPLSKGKSI